LFVSHDRYFINRIASKVLELSKNGAIEFLGDYDYYVDKKLEQAELKALEEQASVHARKDSVAPAKNNYQQDKEAKKLERQKKRRLEEIEEKVELLEATISENEQQLCDPEVYQDHQKVLELNKQSDAAKAELEELMEEWAELAED
jgi:ATP-binding cassette, subfamily F, member 3